MADYLDTQVEEVELDEGKMKESDQGVAQDAKDIK